MIISHGKPQYSYDLVKNVVAKGIKVVTFDTVIADSAGKGVPGVTTMFQSDQEMARLTLDYILDVLLKDRPRPIKVLKLWRGPGIPPFDRRQETYLKYEQAGKIKTLEVLGPSNPADSEGSIAMVVSSILPKYPKGTVDVIWSAYDAYARGAYKALIEANRSDIPLVSIDISNQDINFMRASDKIWKACVATHFSNVGISALRLVAEKLNGDPTGPEYILQPSVILADQLTPEANVTNLGTIIKGYGLNVDNITPWMDELRKAAGAK
jgi:simple sugar transport system substrate-binding protein